MLVLNEQGQKGRVYWMSKRRHGSTEYGIPDIPSYQQTLLLVKVFAETRVA